MSERVVLLVDDEKVVLDTLTQQLDRQFDGEVACETAESVEEAWEVLEELDHAGVRVVVVVSDWLMPGKKGDEFLAELRTRYPSIGRVLLTGHADLQAIERARASAAAQEILFKPWHVDDLRRALEQSMRGSP